MELPLIADGEDKSSILKNRIRKNYRHVRKWAKRTDTNCFRIYDRDIKQYPLAIDYYDGRFCIHYFAKGGDQDMPPLELEQEVNQILHDIFGLNECYWRTRARHKETRQYEKLDTSRDFFAVKEYGASFFVNLVDYLDTGLFMDHRETRQLVAKAAAGKRLLNLFAYTCSFSVQAALSGAVYTKSVDMSNTYAMWGRKNFDLNALPARQHEIVRADCLKYLTEEQQEFDVIVLDPPTISRSKKMDQLFDIQEDYIFLLKQCLRLLAPNGSIYFSTNSRKFKLDIGLFPGIHVQDISSKTLPIDFHNDKIHQCWLLKN